MYFRRKCNVYKDERLSIKSILKCQMPSLPPLPLLSLYPDENINFLSMFGWHIKHDTPVGRKWHQSVQRLAHTLPIPVDDDDGGDYDYDQDYQDESDDCDEDGDEDMVILSDSQSYSPHTC